MKTILLLLLLSSSVCLAQENTLELDVRNAVLDVLTKHIDQEIVGRTPKNIAYLFSITLSFNSFGKIDTVYFPKTVSRPVQDVMKLNSALVGKIKSRDFTFTKYASRLVLISIFYKRIDDTALDYSSGFLKSFENLLPKLDSNMSQKAWVILDPIHVPFSLRTN